MSTSIAKTKDISKDVLDRVNKLQEYGELNIPENYSPANAIKGAWMHLQGIKDKNNKPVLEVCSELSIATALFKMVTNGMSVIKNQCYLVAYGSELTYQPSYFGNYSKAKTMCGVVDANGTVVYEGDKEGFKYETNLDTGTIRIISHEQNIENIDNNKIIGAYATIIFTDGRKKVNIMSMAQIRKAWMFGFAKGKSKAHTETPDQMAIRTVINRGLKFELNSADDSYLNIVNNSKSVGSKSEEEQPEVITMEDPIQEANIVEEKENKEPKNTSSEVKEEVKEISEPKF